MRVKLLLALAIASVLLLCSTGTVFAQSCAPCSITGVPTAAQLTGAADSEIAAFGFPDVTAQADTVADIAALDQQCVGDVGLTAPICGVCGQCPPCECKETTTVFPGPAVNLACPILNVKSAPVNLVSPMIAPVFPAINLAPQATVVVPQVNAQLNCFDITCCPIPAPIDP